MAISKEVLSKLFVAALGASKNAYCPYSHFPVGAALLVEGGIIVTGCNIENRSFGLTNCAERTAVFKAISEGHKDIRAIAIAAPMSDMPVGPCGACRQVLTEFAPPETPVVFGPSQDLLITQTLGALYPYDSLHDLKQ